VSDPTRPTDPTASPLSRLPRRALATARWRTRQLGLAWGGRRLLAAARLLGFPDHPFPGPASAGADTAPSTAERATRRPDDAVSGPRTGACGATVCTVDHFHFALALATSFRRHHPDLDLHVLVVDSDRGDGVEFPTLPGLVVHRGGEVGLLDDPYLALKLNAAELCCAAKPFLLAHLAATTPVARAVYLDSDILLFAPCERLLADLEHSPFVVFPHTIAPLPQPELWWERPSLGDLAFAGVLNAGMFGIDLGDAGQRFLAQWRDLVCGLGAFQGGQTEQNSFNWVIAFADGVRVSRDTAYNVAYWNLHDRSLRCHGVGLGDENAGPEFTVDGRPLVAFHFSGYDLDVPERLSSYDGRHPVHCDRALTELLADYQRELESHGADRWRAQGYRFDRFPSGIPIDKRLRHLFKEHEVDLRREEDPWTPAGEAAHCRALLSPSSRTASLLPLLLASIRAERVDLQATFPGADLEPRPLLRWFADLGAAETGYQQMFDAHRIALPRGSGVRSMLRTRGEVPAAFAGLGEPLGRDRPALVSRLEGARRQDEAAHVARLDCEIAAVSPLHALRGVVEGRPDLHAAYPDLLGADAPAFAIWLRLVGTRTEFVTPPMIERFERAARGGSLARIFSFVDRHPSIVAPWPLALVGVGKEGFARALLAALAGGVEFDLDDVVMYLWLMDEKPWTGVALTLELRANAARVPSPLLPEGQEALLAPVLSDLRFRRALDDHRRQGKLDAGEAGLVRGLDRQRTGPRRSPPSQPSQLTQPSPWSGRRAPGVNLFGFFKSPIGLGTMSHGLASALRSQGVTVRENVVTNQTMDADLSPDDFVRRYDPALDTNLFVSFPHLAERLLDQCPRHRTAMRRNVAYLAWEQRESNRLWEEAYADLDQVWALSSFAAEGLRAALRREVTVVPCVLDVDDLDGVGAPTASEIESARVRHGIGRGRVSFLHTFDANSSIERKNPEAVVAAFARAFRPGDRAVLYLRVSNAHRREHRQRLGRLEDAAAASGLDIRFVRQPLRRRDVLALACATDCYVSLHRAEGFGLTCAEAMAFGKPVIATRYSGNLDFMDDDNSLLASAEEVEVRRAEGPFRRGSLWAEPDVDHAASLLRRVFDDPDAARAIGQRARVSVRRSLSPARVGAIAAAALGHPSVFGELATRADRGAAERR
jgi:glycosyltransferase involved in cell wall biosynthesis